MQIMKRMIVVLSAAVAAAFAGAEDIGCKAVFDGVVSNGVQAVENTSVDDIFMPKATTNLVIAYEIVESSMVPCACPDGYAGCLAQHYRRVTETRYERAVASMPEIYVLQGGESAVMLNWMARRDSNDVAAVSLPCDAEHPVGFVDLRVVRELGRIEKANGERTHGIMPSSP